MMGLMEYALIIERDPETRAVTATSPDIEGLYLVGDPSESDDMIIERFRESIAFRFGYLRERGIPIPLPRHRVAMVGAA